MGVLPGVWKLRSNAPPNPFAPCACGYASGDHGKEMMIWTPDIFDLWGILVPSSASPAREAPGNQSWKSNFLA
ncbi:MAG: hypothetical protein VCA18_06265, partial [Opitutales bacterium]